MRFVRAQHEDGVGIGLERKRFQERHARRMLLDHIGHAFFGRDRRHAVR